MKNLNRQLVDLGKVIRDNRMFGALTDGAVVVVDNVMDRDKRKIRVKAFATTQPKLYTGLSTVAIFKKKGTVIS